MLVVEDGTRQRSLQSLHEAHQCPLATARGSYKCDVVTTVDGQVQSVEEQWHVLGIAELQAAYLYASCDVLHHLMVFAEFRYGRHDRLAEAHLRQYARGVLYDVLQLYHSLVDKYQHGTIGNVVGE